MFCQFKLEKNLNLNSFKEFYIGYSAGPDSTACVTRIVHSLNDFHKSAKSKKWQRNEVSVTLVFCSGGIERHKRVEAQGEALCGRLSEECGVGMRMHVRRAETALWKEAEWSACIREELNNLKKGSIDPVILKGHQLDEQVETYVMWMLRGKKNLMKIWDQENRVARPLLLARKKEIYSYLNDSGFIDYVVEDPTNHIETANQRAYYRQNLAKHIEQMNPGIYRMIKEETQKAHAESYFA